MAKRIEAAKERNLLVRAVYKQASFVNFRD
jgi:hypothetical protein